MIFDDRVHILKDLPLCNKEYVLYWMQASQRAEHNHALCYAIKIADENNLPVIVFFAIDETYPEANLRHYRFMLEGLQDVEARLKTLGIKFIVWITSPLEGVLRLSENAAIVITDFGYLRHQRHWRRELAHSLSCPFHAVESDIVVPVQKASAKEEFSAATLRPKITNLMSFYLELPEEKSPKINSLHFGIRTVDLINIDAVLSEMDIDRTVAPVDSFHGGTFGANKRLSHFIKKSLDFYTDERSDPSQNFTSGLSPYLHFGQISPLFVALKIMDTDSPGRDSFLEELIIRRELAINFVYYNDHYDSIKSLPPWALATLQKHNDDSRQYLYTRLEFEQSLTHDIYWNAAQNELRNTGIIHNYMRMYWGKKIIEWTKSFEEAFDIMVYLNNKYALDGRDPNSFAGIAWCFGKHDRPWKERDIFGTVRYMNENGLKRKFDMTEYVKRNSK
ncbi:MAG TPA: deoxyribodipyrimidine photo-lyase [Spirochaetota bacterium]|nr:deoxyribodipyrimidine photo-lyase [Spirochaetota bacterium]HPD77716.1 deoxyribodipyrimidine photo-lyase [Spirochaetota bacterium]